MMIVIGKNNTGDRTMSQSKSVTPALKVILLLIGLNLLSGCFATKIITVPMRVGGAVISVVPVVGDVADDAIDVAADSVDLIPI